MLVPNSSWAAEELPVEELAVQTRVHRLVQAMEFGFGSLWTMTGCDGAILVRIEATTNDFTEVRIDGITAAQALAIDETSVWISDQKKGAIFEIDPNTYSPVKTIRAPTMSTQGNMAVGEGAVWVLTADEFGDALVRFNARTGIAEAKIALPSGTSNVVVSDGSVWVSGPARHELYRIDPRTNSIASTVELHDAPSFVASGEGFVWVFNQSDSSVDKIDARTGEILANIKTGLPPGSASIATGGGYVWVSMRDAPVTQINPRTNALIRRFIGGHGMGGQVRYGAGSLWLAGGRISRLQGPKLGSGPARGFSGQESVRSADRSVPYVIIC
jgi:streptogramin lyase